MKWFLKRLSEPSSSAGMAAIANGAIVAASGNYVGGGVQILAGLAAFAVNEKK